MQNVDYQKLSEQYASFLVAVGGVSITVLTLVLSLGSNSGEPYLPTEGDSRSFLVVALVVAALSCFVGAQMMAETAAFTQKNKENADRLFLLASGNIFVAIVLVFFALMLLPLSSGKVHLESIKPISIGLFFPIVAGALYWAILAGKYRMRVSGRERAIWRSIITGLIWGIILYLLPISERWFLWLTFAPSALLTIISLAWFAWIFKDGHSISLKKARIQEIWFFSLSITISYASLVAAAIKTMSGTIR
jgi:hypothetical protein